MRSFQITSEQDRCLYAKYVLNVNIYELIPGTAHYWPIEKLKRHIVPGIDQIPAELIETEGRTICYEIHKIINFIWKEEEQP
jgi:hypothetical protein